MEKSLFTNFIIRDLADFVASHPSLSSSSLPQEPLVPSSKYKYLFNIHNYIVNYIFNYIVDYYFNCFLNNILIVFFNNIIILFIIKLILFSGKNEDGKKNQKTKSKVAKSGTAKTKKTPEEVSITASMLLYYYLSLLRERNSCLAESGLLFLSFNYVISFFIIFIFYVCY